MRTGTTLVVPPEPSPFPLPMSSVQEWGTAPKSPQEAWSPTRTPLVAGRPAEVVSRNPLTGVSVGFGKEESSGADVEKGQASLKPMAVEGKAMEGGLEGWDVMHQSFFNAEERGMIKRHDYVWIPVLADFTWEQVRSRSGVALVYTLAALDLFLQVILPELYLPRVSPCWMGAEALAKDAQAGFDPLAFAAVTPFLTSTLPALSITFIVLSMLGLHSWNPLFFVPLSLIATVSYFSLTLAYETGYCVRMLALPPTLVQIQQGSQGEPQGEQVTTVIVFYSLLRLLLILATLLIQGTITARIFLDVGRGREPWRVLWDIPGTLTPMGGGGRGGAKGEGGGEEMGGSPALAPLSLPSPPPSTPSTPPPSLSLSLSLQAQLSWVYRDMLPYVYNDLLASVPLRHATACLLSTMGVLVAGVILTSWASVALRELALISKALENPDDTSIPLSDFVRAFLQVIEKYVPPVWRTAVTSTLGDALRGSSVGIWIVTAVFVLTITSSLGVVGRHFRDLQRSGSVRQQQGGGEDGKRPLFSSIKDLQQFAVFDATQYIIAHLASHILTFLLFSILASTVISLLTALVSQLLGNVGGLVSFLVLLAVGATRAQIYTFLVFRLPAILFRFFSWWGCCGVHKSDAWRRAVGAMCLVLRWMDGTHVLTPRIFLLLDVVFSFTLGPLLALADAVARVTLGSIWGLLSISILYESVVPAQASAFDRAFMAYGGLLKTRLIPLTDSEDRISHPLKDNTATNRYAFL